MREFRPPPSSRKASLSHTDEAFNQQLQADFVFCDVRGTKHCVLHAVDAGTWYSETAIVTNRTNDVMANHLERLWILRHGAPRSFASDVEFDKSPMHSFLLAHGTERKPRPVRRHNKTGVVERKNRTLKSVLELIQFHSSTADDETVLARASFFANVFSGSATLRSFELARGYSLSFLGLPPSTVDPDLFEAAREQSATRAIQRLLNGRAPSDIPPFCLPAGADILYFYKSSKKKDKVEWKRGTVITAEKHFVSVRTTTGRTTRIAYEDIRLLPKSELASKLMEDTVEHAIAADETTDAAAPEQAGDATIDAVPMNPDVPAGAADEISSNPADAISPSALTTAMFAELSSATPVSDEPPPSAPSAGGSASDARRDIGSVADSVGSRDPTGETLQSERDRVLKDIYDRVGNRQMSDFAISFAPSWLLEEAFEKEFGDNWADAKA